jgi:hypothetical protein
LLSADFAQGIQGRRDKRGDKQGDELSPSKVSPNRSTRKASKSESNLRITFNQNLARLYNASTQEKGYVECKKLMQEYQDD